MKEKNKKCLILFKLCEKKINNNCNLIMKNFLSYVFNIMLIFDIVFGFWCNYYEFDEFCNYR